MTGAKALGPMLGRAGHLCRERLDVRLSRYEVTPAQTHVLLCLQDHGGELDQRSVTDFLKVKPSTANGILDRLEEKGMVVRSVSGRDARRRLIALTEKGRRELELFRSAFEAVEELIFRDFTPEESETFFALLERVILNLEEDRHDEEQPLCPGGPLCGLDRPGHPVQRGGGHP